ncbi:MAG: hypothetical protein ACXW2I_02005 [Burkholderiales bacterium]
MIKILVKGTLSCPIFNCDVCGDMIGDISEGDAVYTYPERAPENLKLEVQHVHKGYCRAAAEKKLGYKCDSQTLGAHLYFLCANTELDAKQFDKLKRIHGARTP